MAEIYTTLAEAEGTRHATLRRLATLVSAQKCYGGRLSAKGWHLAQPRTVRPRTPGPAHPRPQRGPRVGSRSSESWGFALVATVDEPDGSLDNA